MVFKRVLIAVDNSTCSEKAAKAGYEIAIKFGAEVALVNIIEPVPSPVSADFTLAPVFIDESRYTEENSYFLLREMENRYAQGTPTTHLSLVDSASHGIISQAEDWKADLIVIGTHGRSGFYHFLMGSVAEHVARKSPCPVMIIPNSYEEI